MVEEWAGLWRNRWVCGRLFLGVGDDNLMLFILCGGGGGMGRMSTICQ